MEKTRSIVVVDDLDENITDILKQIDSLQCGYRGEPFSFRAFNSFIDGQDAIGTTVLLEQFLNKMPISISLLVLDHELSHAGRALTDATFVEVAEAMGVPVARYHRAVRAGSDSVFAAQKDHMSSMRIDFDEYLGRNVCALANGFDVLREKVDAMPNLSIRYQPATILANALAAPGLALELEQYLTARDVFDPKDLGQNNGKRRLATRLGYWLRNVILQYPGIILNRTAAASYVGIDPDDFDRNDVGLCFEGARYRGPFADEEKYWWRPKLDDMLGDLGGVEFVAEKAHIDVHPCACSVRNTPPAGYYDIATDRPISYDESIGDLQWIPPGADLARINKYTYEEEGPLQ